MKRKLLVIDTETGGLDPSRHAIISLAAIVYNDGGIDGFGHWIIYDPTGELEESALKLNGFTKERIREEGVTPWQAVQSLQALLSQHDMRGRVTLAGHNLAFDIGFLQRLYSLGGADFAKQFHHGGLDTKAGALMLEQAGRLSLPSSSLIDVAPACGVPHTEVHDALVDATATAKVLRRMIDLIRHTDWPTHSISR